VPANLTPDYLEAERRFRLAQTMSEKIEALEDMLATIPKHKGTEKMQADIKRRLARLRQEAQQKRGGGKRPVYIVDKQGAGQVVMVGPPNAGKSQLLAALSNASPEVAPYPFTTRLPLAGMVQFENVQIQLVDLPPLAREGTPPWLPQVVRNADALLMVVDGGSDDVLEQVETTLDLLGEARIAVRTDERAGEGKAVLAAVNKCDLQGARDRLAILEELFGARLKFLPVSGLSGFGLQELKRALYEILGVIRVYTKAPGKDPDFNAPFIMKAGTTIIEAAATVHKEIARNLKYARVWGAKTFPGQMVQRDYVLSEGDIVEFHT